MQSGITESSTNCNSKGKPDDASNCKKDDDEETIIIDDDFLNNNLDSSNETKDDNINEKEKQEEQNEQSSLIKITNLITNSLINQTNSNQNESPNTNIINETNISNNNNNNNYYSIVEEEEEEIEDDERNPQTPLSEDDKNKKESIQQNTSEGENQQLQTKNDIECPKAIEENNLLNLSNTINNKLISHKNIAEEEEYEYEEEEEEEEEDEAAQNAPKKHLPPPHLLEAHQIPNTTTQNKKSKNDSIEDLENEVMITGYATPKTDIEDETNNDIKGEKKISQIKKDKLSNKKPSKNTDIDEADLEKALNRFLKTKKLPDLSIRAETAEFARQKTLQLMLEEDYDNAFKMKTAVDQLSSNIKNDKRIIDEKEITENIENRISEATQLQKDIKYKYIDKIEEFEKLQKQSHEKLLEKHRQEIENFLAEWDDEKKLIPFLKQSPKLLQLRQMQKLQAITMNFDQAKQLKKAADKLQKDETQVAKLNASNAMRAEYNALLKQQQTEIELWTQNWERKRQTIEAEKKQEEEANENLRNQLNNKLRNPKMPKKQSVILPISITPRKSATLITRTSVKTMMIEYKNKTTAARLDLRPAEIKAIVKPKLQSPRKLTSSFS